MSLRTVKSLTSDLVPLASLLSLGPPGLVGGMDIRPLLFSGILQKYLAARR